MRLLRPAPLLASLVLLAAMALPAPAADLALPQLHYQQRPLPNGLQVLSVEDPGSTTVAVQMW